MPVSKYKCGLESGNYVRLKKKLVVKDAKGKRVAVHNADEMWKVVNGSKEKPLVVWLRQPDGRLHTWDDNNSIFHWFELIPGDVFDVVNERDEVIDRKPRSEVHLFGLLHRAVHVLVFNARGETFLQKRSMTKDREPGKWDSSTSGHLDSGEDYDACAVRELREEIGLAVTKTPERLFKIAARPETDQEFVWVYRCQAEGPFRLHPNEIERGDWFAPDKITRWMTKNPDDFASAFRFIWRKLNANALGKR